MNIAVESNNSSRRPELVFVYVNRHPVWRQYI